MGILRRLKAKKHGVPFKITNHWSPYYFYKNMDGTLPTISGYKVLDGVYNRFEGDVVPLLTNGKITHFYKIISWKRLRGSDHAASDIERDLIYYYSEKGTRHND